MLIDNPIPVPEAYDVSLRVGFLPEQTPCDALSDPYYAPWQDIAKNLQNLLMCRRLRTMVDNLPVLACDRIQTTAQLRKAYSILSFICHAYIWGEESPAQVVPPSVSIPFLQICNSLELPPVATYAAVVLWNFKRTFAPDQVDRLDNIATQLTFTGAIDESWFYLVSVAIEARGGPLISIVLDAVRCVRVNDAAAVAKQLLHLIAGIKGLTTLMQRMYENCDPHFFYYRIRPFLAGSKNMAKQGLPYGVLFDDGTGTQKPVQFAGGSNAQSSMIQFLDIALGIKHKPTKSSHGGSGTIADSAPPTPPEPSSSLVDESDFITDMRQYMPGSHRRFLRHFAMVANIRPFVELNPHHEQLTSAYGACITALVDFRNSHLQMVSRYIILQKAQSHPGLEPCRSSAFPPLNQGNQVQDEELSGEVPRDAPNGTGGTMLIPFLKQARDETRESYFAGLINKDNCTSQ